MAVVYKHVKKDTKEVFYVGIGENIKRAFQKSGRKKHWKYIVDKHGYDVIILHENISWDDACLLEIQLISEIGRQDLGTGPLINLTNGGEGAPGRIVKESTKQLNREKQTGRRYGDKTRQKLSEMRKGVSKPIGFGDKISKFQKENGGFFKGKKHKEESKRMTSEKLLGEKNHFYGKKHTKEVVIAMSGPNSSNAKFTEEQIKWIRNNYTSNSKQYGCNALARQFKVSPTNISNIINYKSYTNV